nr:hypothetical protein Iba_chr12aCG3030 [Ipomoea batatas]
MNHLSVYAHTCIYTYSSTQPLQFQFCGPISPSDSTGDVLLTFNGCEKRDQEREFIRTVVHVFVIWVLSNQSERCLSIRAIQTATMAQQFIHVVKAPASMNFYNWKSPQVFVVKWIYMTNL